jgi:Ser/Thr protein kinase RdoA (MazF antagonist)
VLVESLRDSGGRLDLVREAAKLLDRDADLAPQWDNPSTGVVHGDLHLDNVWWDGTHVSGVLDLEWVRAAPPYVDLARVKDNADADEADGIQRHQLLLAVLVRERPDIAAVDRLPERIRLLQVAHQLRQLWVDGVPSDEAATLPSDHPVSALTSLLGAASA